MDEPQPEAVRVIRAWYRLELATRTLSAHIRREVGITGEQLALLRILGERGEWPLAELRARLTMHPATLGQSLDRLAQRGLVSLVPDPQDGRRRRVSLTDDGRQALQRVPAAGPGILRGVHRDPAELARVAAAFESAIELFGLEDWAP